ncbi:MULTISPECIES: hypothetical protein [unclassified Aureimonas]|uniref:hypothetical protein n=1 Tax=unclassified Aureimonas TaxID=2615206 RepID=UPI000700AD87|nr:MULTISPECIES: hypothetical protein [unclassified Aureimonas]KQT60422.1 hypothetical protein ASG62_07170 [Aureimonas sp. Leaf427]KQT79300.1 hypothetical protein ASG54_09770 [Aureimonas sp. Leaf460]
MTDPSIEDALRRLEAGDWDGAHRLVQDIDGEDAAWIHAHLHRLEGDLGNAAYWYRRAGRPVETGDLEAERAGIVATLRTL